MPRKPTDLYRRFCEHFDKSELGKAPSFVIAFSGGVDSSVLLHLFYRLSKERKLSLHALHLDHKIRAESASDAAFCQAVCREYDIPFALFTEDIPAYAKANKLGLEEAARKVRYATLEQYRKAQSIALIATAHNATDNAETVLFHLSRGAALRGVSGIYEKRDAIIRPLLPFSKSEILAYAEENGISYCVDQTNFDTAYTRNYIRHTLLPPLAAINPSYEEAIYRFSQDAREDDDTLYAIAADYADCSDTQVLAKLPPAILRRVLLIKYRKIAHNEISRSHLIKATEAITLASHGNFSGELSLPDTVSLKVNAYSVRFVRQPESEQPIAQAIPLSENDDLLFCHRFRIVVDSIAFPTDTQALFTLTVPKSALPDITVRSRQNGDRYRQGGMTRNIKKMLCDAKIPLEDRDTLPLILYKDSVLFVPHLAPSDLAAEWSKLSGEAYRISIYEV